MPELIKVAEKKSVFSGQPLAIEVKGKRIALFLVDGQYYAIDDECTHASGPLSEGSVEGKVVTCPWHGATFDICTGAVLGEPAYEGVKSYPVHLEGDDIKIEI